MVDTVNQRIDRFTKHFQGHLLEISQLDSKGKHVLHYQRILYVTVIDTLAKVVFPNTGNRQRNINLLSQFSEWKEHNRISLPHLIRLLKLAPEPSFEQLRLFAMSKHRGWISGEIIDLDRDLTFQEVKNMWPRDSEYKFPIREVNKSISLESLQHVNLFYEHRNSLVHEFRMLGLLSGSAFFSRDEPYYSTLLHEFDSTGAEIETWELQYPLEFYKRITEKCLTNVSSYLQCNQIDPISFFTSGSFWIRELNT